MNMHINLIRLRTPKTLLAGLTLLIFSVGCHKTQINNNNNELHDFQQVNLVANSAAYAPAVIDPTLLNAWGIAWSPTGIAWVNSLGGHVSELYTGEGAIVRPPVNVPSPLIPSADCLRGLYLQAAQGLRWPIINLQPFCSPVWMA